MAEEVFNQGNLSALSGWLSEDFFDHSAIPGAPAGIPGYHVFVTMVRTAFPDIHIHLHDLLAEGDKVVLRWSMHGTNSGPFMDMPATDKLAQWTGTHTYRLADGRIVEHWGYIDMIGILRQLGQIPS